MPNKFKNYFDLFTDTDMKRNSCVLYHLISIIESG